MFDTADGRQHGELFTGAVQVSGLAFSPDGRRLYAAGWGMDGVKVFDPARDPRGRRVPVFDNQIGALSFDSAGLRILQVYWTKGGALGTADPFDGSERIDRRLPVANSCAFLAETSPLVATAGGWRCRHGGTRRWSGSGTLPSVGLIVRLQGRRGAVTAVAFGPDGRSLATRGAGGPEGRPIVALWNLDSGRRFKPCRQAPTRSQAVAFSDDGRKVAAGGGTRPDSPGWVTVWDAETGTVL